jgi:hypothetical protein
MLSIYMFLVQCCDVRNDFRVKRCLICLNSHLSCRDSCFIYAICIFYVYWCPTRFPYQIMFVSLNSNTTDVTYGAELLTLLEHLSSSPVFGPVHVARSLVFCVVFCRYLQILIIPLVSQTLDLLYNMFYIIIPAITNTSNGSIIIFQCFSTAGQGLFHTHFMVRVVLIIEGPVVICDKCIVPFL